MTTNNHGVQSPDPQVNTSPSYLMGEVGLWRPKQCSKTIAHLCAQTHGICVPVIPKDPDLWYSLLSLQGSRSYNHSHIGSGSIINSGRLSMDIPTIPPSRRCPPINGGSWAIAFTMLCEYRVRSPGVHTYLVIAIA